MGAYIIDGKAVAAKVEQEVKVAAEALEKRLSRKVGLAVILVGDNPASKVYVANKSKKAKECNLKTFDITLSATTSQRQLEEEIQNLNESRDVDGILLQLPLPKGLDEFSALMTISPKKDVDGLHPFNQGLLMRGEKTLEPCTPKGSMLLIEHARTALGLETNLDGLNAVVVGRSILVGKAAGLMLLSKNCTVTFCHSKTKDLRAVCQSADILVAAIGKPQMLKRDFVKPRAIVIDVGINRTAEGKLVGDVDYADVLPIAGAITPVPGGVGPMTIAMLLQNTVTAAASLA